MQIWSGATDLNIFLARNFLKALEDAGSDPLDFFLIQIAQLHGKSYAARNHIACAGLHSHPADGTDLPSWFAPHFLAHGKNRARGGGKRIPSPVHRRRARVIGEAAGGTSA